MGYGYRHRHDTLGGHRTFLSPYIYADQSFSDANAWPSAAHWFGTDSLGRDLFVRVLYGARISLSIGLVASLINVFIGVLYGGIAALAGGRIDRIMMHVVDILYSIPMLLYVILLMVVFKPGLINIYLALGIAYWLNMARVVRGQILSLKQQENTSWLLVPVGRRPGRFCGVI